MNQSLRVLILTAIALAMGVATLVLNLLGSLESRTAISLLALGLFSLALAQLQAK